jgi:hypothetical protein
MSTSHGHRLAIRAAAVWGAQRSYATQPRLDALLSDYKREPQLVIALSTASLVAAYESRIELCTFNKGFAHAQLDSTK